MADVGSDPDKAFNQALGAAIRRRREHMPAGKLTARQVAARVGIPEKSAAVTMSRIESGAIAISQQRLAAIAQALGTTARQLHYEATENAAKSQRRSGGGAADVLTETTRWMRSAFGGPQVIENEQRRRRIDEEVTARQERTTEKVRRLLDVQREVLEDVLAPFLQQAALVDCPPPPVPPVEQRPAEEGLQDRLHVFKRSTSAEMLRAAARMRVGLGEGERAGSPMGALAAVSAIATESTQEAIGTSGARAASSAAFAWSVGASSLVGGVGLAAGTAAWVTIATLPGLIAAGSAAALQVRRIRRLASEEAERLTQAEKELNDSKPALDEVWSNTDRARSILERILTQGLRETRWLTREIEASEGAAKWDLADAAFRDRFERLTDLATVTAAVLSLPILRDLDPDATEDPDGDGRHQWIELVLTDAAAITAA